MFIKDWGGFRYIVFFCIVVGFVNQKGYVGSFNPKEYGWWLMYWTHPSIWVHTSDFMWNQLCLVMISSIPYHSRSVEICRSQDVKFASTLIPLYALESFYAWWFIHEVVGTWIWIPCWWPIYSSVRTLIALCICSFFFFFSTWFRARTRVRWVALDCLLGLIRTDLIYHDVFCLDCTWVRSNLSPTSYLFVLFYMFFLLS